MNERIRKLAIKSGIDIRGHLTGNLTLDEKPNVIDLEKFAELIVRECMSIAKQVEDDEFPIAGAEQDYRKGLNDGRKNAAWGIKNRMKQHFGVEE